MGRRWKIDYCLCNGDTFRNFDGNQVRLGYRVHAVRKVAYEDRSFALRRCPEFGGVTDQWSENAVPTVELLESVVQNESEIGGENPQDILHYKKRGLGASHETEELTDQGVSLVCGIPFTDVAETLARRPADHTVHAPRLNADRVQDLARIALRKVAAQKGGMGKVLFEAKGESLVDIDRQSGRETGEMGTETEAAGP